jgi:hypothetical protein
LRVASQHRREGPIRLGPIGDYLIGGILGGIGWLDGRRLDTDGGWQTGQGHRTGMRVLRNPRGGRGTGG